MRRISKGKESILHYTRFSSVWMDEVAALYSVLSLSLSLTRGIRDSNIFSNNDPEFFVRKLYRNTRFKKCFAIISCHRTHRITCVLSSESQNILNALLVPTCTL